MSFFDKLHETFVVDDRWQYLTNGLKITLLVTFFASLLGIVLGFLIAIVRSTHDKTGKLPILNAFSRLYLTVIRGTPVLVQLMIIYFVIFASVNVSKVFVAVMALTTGSLKRAQVWDSTTPAP